MTVELTSLGWDMETYSNPIGQRVVTVVYGVDCTEKLGGIHLQRGHVYFKEMELDLVP